MNVVISGCSTGIGEACARWLDRKGHRVFAGVRKLSDGERLRAGASGRLRPVVVDVTDSESIARAREAIEQQLGGEGLDGLVNNAGIAVAAPLEHVPLDDFRRQLEVNVVGQLALTQAMLPLIRLVRGRIIFMGSIAGRMAVPFLGPYAASKFALEALADALRVEVQPWGIQVSVLEPGSVSTPIWQKGVAAAEQLQSKLPGHALEGYAGAMEAVRHAAATSSRRGIPAEAVALAVEHALTARAPKTRYLVGRDARLQALLAALVPDRVRDRLITRSMRLPPRR
jgi:NAD(P)-dependent dehydrogenase (short-subunit alcohol dehydrogenase family)